MADWFQSPFKGSVIALLLVGLLGGAGLVAVQGGWHTTASQQIVAEEVPVTYTVILNHVYSLHPKQLFTPGQTVQLTVRNRPRGEVTVLDVAVIPKKALVPVMGSADPKGYKLVDDELHPHEADIIVTLSDTATQAREGFVAKGVKIKTGMHVVLEDFDAFQDGVIADVQAARADAAAV